MDLAQYACGLAGLMVLVVIQLAQSPMVGIAKGKLGIAPGCEPEKDYNNPAYRIHRMYGNTAENLAPMAVTVFAAMAIGVSVWWVSILVWVHVIARIGYWIILQKGIGKAHQGARTMVYVAGWAANLILALVVFVKAAF